MHVCMYISFAYVCIYSYLYEYIYFPYACVGVDMQIRMRVHVCMYECMYACMQYACMHVCMYACVCMYVCMNACMHVCSMHVCMYACMHVCMYVCMRQYKYITILVEVDSYLHVYSTLRPNYALEQSFHASAASGRTFGVRAVFGWKPLGGCLQGVVLQNYGDKGLSAP